jgi:aconitate hydratase
MGVLPLVFKENENLESLGLTGSETFYISGIQDMSPRKVLQVKAVAEDGKTMDFEVISRLDTDVDVEYFENGGILQYVLRKVLQNH